ncbi:metalloregulator ArsR/SmtB family transcription factor [Paenibacillus polysaccharolyticus]|uniref:Transcriptional regulator, ArsR family n=2 Tax=Paenibacillus TaxID=44249 RepID=A0A1G5EEL4_9BACL|nr:MULTISPECIES: metalloregulator ArsR/SmtB family transcription factor [Paenibacillus]MBY0203438.1 winged helix-turn-helix transcriptional regulator [Paenibacillus cucumis (ex Kampfer et al. 2016)]MCP1133168.1 metalloregulator ArsR/SmtB family transcription factor [Paenibacillus polysaccharolyticus]MDP9697229.1 ArsR family transcriptional regulator [Paenibacillus intestini]SCY25429.1 transcriptional regulator, ArsR family [Paenibacillus polysaccharolyticus]
MELPAFDRNQLKQFDEPAEFLKALSHPVRLCIVRGLMRKKKCNVSYMQECLDLPQSTVSQHLQKLRSAGIVATERNGLEVNYVLADSRAEQLVMILFKEDGCEDE